MRWLTTKVPMRERQAQRVDGIEFASAVVGAQGVEHTALQ